MAGVLTCCLTALSHYLNQCWLIIKRVLWPSFWQIFYKKYSWTYSYRRGDNISKSLPHFHGANLTGADLTDYLMMTSSNANIFRVTGHLRGNSPVTGEFPSQRPVTRSFDVFFDLRLKKNGWVNNRDAGDLRRHRAHYDVIVLLLTLVSEVNHLRSFWSRGIQTWGQQGAIAHHEYSDDKQDHHDTEHIHRPWARVKLIFQSRVWNVCTMTNNQLSLSVDQYGDVVADNEPLDGRVTQWQWQYQLLATRFAAYPGCRWAHLTKRSAFYVD